jgi:hypothetical protein
VAANLIDVLGQQCSQLTDDRHGVDLELQKLRWPPASDDLVVFLVDVEVHQQTLQEVLLNDDLASLLIAGITAHMEDLSPEQLLQFQVLLSNQEKWLGLASVDFVVNGV